jgi:D-alanyl-D-alanine carboxypeptidase
MSAVRSTTGYLTSRSGREFCFAFMVNHYSDGQAAVSLREALITAITSL